MRRVVAQIVVVGLAAAGAGGAVGAGGAGGAAAARPRAPAGAGRRSARLTARLAGFEDSRARGARGLSRQGFATRVVRFAGYAIDVPRGWPVYRLAHDPSLCVRYDRHAVYLGTPGNRQQCPAHLVGRVSTLSLRVRARPAPTGPVWRRPAARSGVSARLPHVSGVVLQDVPDQRLRAVIRDSGLTATATYTDDAPVMGQILDSVRPAAGASAARARAAARSRAGSAAVGPPGAALDRVAAPQDVAAPQASTVSLTAAGNAAHSSAEMTAARGARAGAARRRGRKKVLRGFDTCAAPSTRVMRTWRRAYAAAAIYIGGPERACGYGNLSRRWVRQVTAMGWSLLPTYVGRQAPCDKRFRLRIHPRHAKAEGEAAARDAIKKARALGLRRGAPIYDDMEAYDSGKRLCRDSVLSFLDGWTRELRAHHYVSGVYSSAASAIRDLGRASRVYGRRIAKPGSYWFGMWDGHPNLQATPYVRRDWWQHGHRVKQYRGAHKAKVGGAVLDIDSDVVFGAVYR